MHKIDSILTTTSKPRSLLFLVVLTIINFSIIGVLTARLMDVSGGYTLLDFSFGHTAEGVNTTLSHYGAEGLALYRWVQRIDLIHPLIYSLLFASLFFLLYRQTRFHHLLYLPLAMGALDYLENIFLFLMVNSYPNISATVIQIASLLSVTKNVVQYVTIAAFLIGLVAFVVRRVRKREVL